MKKLLFSISAVLLLCGLGLTNLNAQPVVVPNANEFVEGGFNNIFPFGNNSPMRYQQIYSSTQLLECGLIVQKNLDMMGLGWEVP